MTRLLVVLLCVVPCVAARVQKSPTVGVIDFYGLRSIQQRSAREALDIKEGDAPPASRAEARAAELRLEALPGVERARVSVVCCDAGKTILYVGIDERGASPLRFRSAPAGAVRLPAEVVRAGEMFSEALDAAVTRGDTGEDDSRGHALSADPEARRAQERFVKFAAADLPLLRRVLRESGDARHRALAAEIIPYTDRKREIVPDLVRGMSDPDATVRNNSLRALAVLAGYAASAPGERIKVPVEPFVDLLNSVEWTDRNKASLALFQLTAKRDPALLQALRERALPSLAEMARWKVAGHAQASFFILGRVGGATDEEIYKAWTNGDREALIAETLRNVGAK